MLIVLTVILGDVLSSHAYLGVITLMIEGAVDKPGRETGLLTQIGNKKHLGLNLIAIQVIAENILRIATVGKIQQSLEDILMVHIWLDINELSHHLRTFKTDISCGLIIGYLTIERTQLRNLNEFPEALLHNQLASDVELIVAGLLGENCRPGVETMDVLCVKCLGTQIFEKQIKLSKGVTDSRTTEEGRTKVAACALLNRPDGVHQGTGHIRSIGFTQTGDTLVLGRECQILECLALIDKDMVNAHRLEVNDIISTLGETMIQALQL